MEVNIINTLKEAKPALRNEFDAVAIVFHCVMRELGFKCVGLGEQPSNNENFEQQVIPEGWNHSSDAYAFLYKHPQSSMTFIIKSLVLNDKLLVHGLAKEDNKVYSLELNVKEYVNEKAALDNFESLYKDIEKLVTLFKINITSKLLPMLNKPGYEAGPTETTATTDTTRREAPRREPLAEPYRPFHPQPSVVDPLRIPGTGPRTFPPPGVFPVGYADQFPVPLAPGIIHPGAMGDLVGPAHPGFGAHVTDPYANIFGGPDRNAGLPRGTRLPRGAVPPGARFDPFGPPPPGSNPLARGQFGGPDPDDLPPPGYDNMFL